MSSRRSVCPTFTNNLDNFFCLYVERLIQEAFEEKTGEVFCLGKNVHGNAVMRVGMHTSIGWDEAYCRCADVLMEMPHKTVTDDNCYTTVYDELFGKDK